MNMKQWAKHPATLIVLLMLAVCLYGIWCARHYFSLQRWLKQEVASEAQEATVMPVVDLPVIFNEECAFDVYSPRDQRSMVAFMLESMLRSGRFQSKTHVVLEISRDSSAVPWVPSLCIVETGNAEQSKPPYAVRITFQKVKVVFTEGKPNDIRVASLTH